MTRPDTCPLADTTTIAWLYGEGPEDHVHHVAGCADCTAVTAEHADVLAAVGPVLGDLAEPDIAAPVGGLAAPELPSVVGDAGPSSVAANGPWLLMASLAVAAAAIVALVLWSAPVGTPDAPDIALVDDAVEAPVAVVEDAPSPLDEGVEDDLIEDLDISDEPVLDAPQQRVADLLAPEPADDTGLAADDGPDGPDGDEPVTGSPTRVAVLDLLGSDPADDAFSEGLDGLLDDFAALEADLATL